MSSVWKNGPLIAVLVLGLVCLTGCEPLRKKFTRQKKQQAQSETMPVLEPIDYPDIVETPENLLRQHYGLWKVWYGQTMIDLQENATDKRLRFDLSQLLAQLELIRPLFSAGQAQTLQGYHDRLGVVAQKFEQPAALRNRDLLRQEINAVDKEFRARFRPETAKEFLLK